MNDKLKLLEEQIEARTYALDVLIELYNDTAKEAVIKRLTELGNKTIPDVDALVIGVSWDCPTSPTGHCAYDEDNDPGDCDQCLFCGDPEERK